MKTVIISLGGSLIVPDKIDIKFLNDFKKTIIGFVKKGYRFVIICGGGKTARNYQKAASQIGKQSNEYLDWLGIHATKVNTWFLKAVFGGLAEKFIVEDPTKKVKFSRKILLASGWKPGWSTDYDAVLLAKNLGVKAIINMSNIDYVYDRDPKNNNDAKKIKNICWKHYRKIAGSRWKAGLNKPFDPVAAKEADRLKLKVIIIGKNLKNFENVVLGKEFKGTTIK